MLLPVITFFFYSCVLIHMLSCEMTFFDLKCTLNKTSATDQQAHRTVMSQVALLSPLAIYRRLMALPTITPYITDAYQPCMNCKDGGVGQLYTVEYNTGYIVHIGQPLLLLQAHFLGH